MIDKVKENKKEDNRALKQFLIIMVVAVMMGGLVGFLVGYVSEQDLSVGDSLVKFLGVIAPYVSFVLATILLILNFVYQKLCRNRFATWDGEDEAVMVWIANKMNTILMGTTIVMIISFFFLGAGIHWIMQVEKNGGAYHRTMLIILLAGFVYMLVIILCVQRAAVNFEKERNPEKKGSVYDINFQKKWLESCDEAERLQIYKASYHSYIATMVTCIAMWAVSLFGLMAFDFGLEPLAVVTVIWLVQTISYCLACMHFTKHPSEIMK